MGLGVVAAGTRKARARDNAIEAVLGTHSHPSDPRGHRLGPAGSRPLGKPRLVPGGVRAPARSSLPGARVLFCLTALTSTFVRWYVVVRSQGLPFRLRDAVKVGFLGNAVDLIVPAQVGGDVLKAAYLCRLQPRRTRAIAAIMIDRAIGVLGLLLLASLAGALRWSASGPPVKHLIQLVWFALAVGSAGLATVFVPGWLRPFERLAAHHERPRRIVAELHAMGMAYRDRKAALALGSGDVHGFA